MVAPDAATTVAFDVTPMVAPRTGIGHFVAELSAALGHLDDGPDLIPYVLSRRAPLDSDALPSGTRRLPVPASLAVQLWARFGRPALDRRLSPAAVIHGTNYVAPPSRRAAVVITVHDCAFARFPELCSPAARLAGRAAARLAHRGAWVHTPSEFVAAEVRELFRTDRVRAVPHGVPHLPEASDAGPVPGRPYVLSLGTLEPRKRHADLVVAFGELAPDHPDLDLVLAGGDGPARPEIETALRSLPEEIRRRVRIEGRVDDPTRARFLRGAAVFAYPSLYEGFGLPVIEAMAMGTPVVTASSGGVKEHADGAAVFVEGGAHELAGALDRVLTDDRLRAKLVDAGRERSAGFTWAATAARMAGLYEEARGG